MELIRLGIRPRDIVTRKALENAARVVAATGGSTNGALHLPAIAHEAGIKFDLDDVAKIFKSTPYIAELKPGGRYVEKDMYQIGGVQVVLNEMIKGSSEEHTYEFQSLMSISTAVFRLRKTNTSIKKNR